MNGRLHIGIPHEAAREPEVCAWLDVQGGAIWYVNDTIINLSKVPPGPVGWMFALTKSAPGFRFNKLSRLALGGNLKKLKAWFEPHLKKAPPTIWIPGHGELVTEDTKARVETLFGFA